MAASYSCDGCQKPIGEPIKVGHALKRDYCAECEPVAKAFVDAEEELRRKTNEKFQKDRGALVAKASKGGFKLPDVP